MSWNFLVIAPALLLTSMSASAQSVPLPGEGDPRIQSVEYRSNQIVPLRAASGYQVTIELASDERIESVALGDTGAWQISANKAGNLLFVKPVQVGVATNMTIVTDVRSYSFELTGVEAGEGNLPYTLRFTYPSSDLLGPQGIPNGLQAGPMVGDYRLRGDRSLFPFAISDDGARTFIDWPPDGPLPAVFGRNADGRETLLNGNMRGKLFVIDGVERQLVFRIDKRRARADRLSTQVDK